MSTESSHSKFPPSALPTPPISDHPSEMLRAIIAYYQRERMWIKHTQDFIAFIRQNHAKNGTAFNNQTPVSNHNHSNVPIWKRRKATYRLHLSDLSPVKLSHRSFGQGVYGPKVLELFASLLEARIESCKRLDKLISQNTQRKQLLLRQSRS